MATTEPEPENVKRVKLAADAQEEEEGAAQTDAAAESEAKEEEQQQAEPEEVVDPRKEEIDNLAKEFGDDEEDFQVVIGPMNSTSGGSKPGQQPLPSDGSNANDPAAKARLIQQQNLPRNRFSGSSLTAGLWIPMTPEVEEALRMTGVTPSNYPQKLNPGGVVKHRSALDYDLDELESQRWRDPGANQSDFFNYGLNEQTWKEYAARQVAVRLYRMQKAKEAQEAAQEAGYHANET
jgi:hypothetical protein